jgi:hypothetical protein
VVLFVDLSVRFTLVPARQRRAQNLASLKCAVALQEDLRLFRQRLLDVLRQLGGPCVWVHEGRVGLHHEAVEGNHPVLEDLADAVLRLVLPEVP